MLSPDTEEQEGSRNRTRYYTFKNTPIDISTPLYHSSPPVGILQLATTSADTQFNDDIPSTMANIIYLESPAQKATYKSVGSYNCDPNAHFD